MATPSNLYAEKIFSEHPISMWALDDNADYISLISEADRDVTTWTLTNASATSGTVIGQPFPDSASTLIQANAPVSPATTLCTSPDIFNFGDIYFNIKTFSIGTYFYSASPFLTKISIGFEYTDIATSLPVQVFKDFDSPSFNKWSFISETFEIPNQVTDCRVLVKFSYDDGGSAPDYYFYLNGITVGQWSENFNATSLGVIAEPLLPDIPTFAIDGVAADSYGLGGSPGYYLVEDDLLLAYNTAVPMVFGGSNITRLRPSYSPTSPSLIVPAHGFLNKNGEFKEYTAEFWIRLNSNSTTAKKIFGSLVSDDGIYVEGGHITLAIGESFGSYFISEWYRPMLIDFRIIKNSASLLINGAEVISLEFDTSSFPPAYDKELMLDYDWLGFYAYDDIFPVELDAIAIYPYSVPASVAKRRWVYGQAVFSPESINSAYNGTQAFIDYPFAKYDVNYNYPDYAKWEQGKFDNLVTTSLSVGSPDYRLPEIIIENQTLENLYADNATIQDINDNMFISFRPNSDWDNNSVYFNFNNFNTLLSPTNAMYAVFSTESLSGSQTLFRIVNQVNNNAFFATLDDDVVNYSITYGGATELIYTTEPIVSGDKFAVGIKVDSLSNFFGDKIADFFGNTSNTQVYFGGDGTLESQFVGKIYSIGFSTQYDSTKIANYFDQNGIAIIEDPSVSGYSPVTATALLSHTASYTLLPFKEEYAEYFLDISISGYWEDYMPLSYFAKYVTDRYNNEYYDIDFLQFNLGYPAPANLSEFELTSSWSYNELENEYFFPTQRTYEELDNALLTGWNDYEDMSQKAVKFFKYDTENAEVRPYISFQYVANGANYSQDYFTTTVPPSNNRVIDINEYLDWQTTRFELIDNTIIYPIKSVNFNELAIVYHLDFKVHRVISKAVELRRLQLASQSFNYNSFNPIGTRFGVDMYPYKRSGIYFDYKTKNPFTIYKGSTPYLYLSKNSGIEIIGDFKTLESRGIAIPVNVDIADKFRVSAVQMWVKFDSNGFSPDPVELFDIEYQGNTIKFYMQAIEETATRAKIFSKDLSTGQEFNGISYYWNGSIVREPIITEKEWGVLGIGFATALNYDLFLGAINLTGPVLFNNVAYYKASSLQQAQSVLTRPWLGVKEEGLTEYEWTYWKESFLWQGVLVISASDLYGVNPGDVYKTYIGTNKIIVDDGEGLMVDADTMKIYTDNLSSIRTSTPV